MIGFSMSIRRTNKLLEQQIKIPTAESDSGLTYKQQLKQDAMLWAEFLYSEYKREKILKEENNGDE